MAAKTGRKSKYDTYVKPHLDDIRKWAAAGATEEEICKALGIAVSTFNSYKSQFAELKESLRTGRQKVVLDIKGALYKKALGFEYEERRVVKKDGEIKNIEIYQRYCPPDTTAAAMLLRNLEDEWRDKDALTNDIKKQEIELRKVLAESQNW